MTTPRYSIIVPVYNRPQELEELLDSLTHQSFSDFEVVVVEDGSSQRSDAVVERYSTRLRINYIFKQNSGPGPSRNIGFSRAKGDLFVVFDSDCIIPPDYLTVVDRALQQDHWDAWGGPDKAHENFTVIQRAMGYTMSSVLTTGGIRGGKKRLGWFQPRSFNMGIRRKVFESTGGFQFDRYAEDIEFSIRIRNMGYKVGLIPDAYVYHKRRTDFSQFFRQVSNFGKGRALIGARYPEEVKFTHWIPAIFVMAISSMLILPFFSVNLFFLALVGFILYMASIFLHSLSVNRDLMVALYSVPSAFLQLWGYGIGFLKQKVASWTTGSRNLS